MKIISANHFSDEVIIGSNPEMADMGNPSGLIYGRVFEVEAISESGRRFIHKLSFEKEEVAKKLSAKVASRGNIDPEHWVEGFEVYGSGAWIAADNVRAMEHMVSPLAGFVREF
jgi:hypothetical protein